LTTLPPSAPVVLVGLMGSGKTTIARLLARALDRRMHDSDPELLARYGMTAAEMLARDGVEMLHAREAEHLRDALEDRPPTVIAAAASTVEDPASRALLKPAVVVWLDAPDAVLAERMLSGAHRPHFEEDLEAMLRKQRARREPLFQEVADLKVDVSDGRPEEAAATVLRALGVAHQ
jgi:shikimate kinase